MELDHNHCYSSIKSRDERFDGRFFTGVLTTGIYCRPICPAPTPRPENVRFYPTAAAAAEAGFRPCLRCRPESSPGTPEWQGSSATVSRALRLIGQGAMDEGGVDDVAGRLHIGPRQLRRLFQQHLGVSPVAVAQTRRVHFAKKLIDETNLSMTDIAFSAGFNSIRRFNDAIRQSYHRPPTALRRQRRKTTAADRQSLILKLGYRPPFDWSGLAAFLQARAIPGVEQVNQAEYRRTVSFGELSGVISVRPEPGQHALWLAVPLHLHRHLLAITERVRRLFDLTADPLQITGHLSEDPLLAPHLAANPGPRLPGAWDGFEIAVRAILGQQVSIKAATTLAGRLAARCGAPLDEETAAPLSRLFPTPAQLAEADLDGLGLTGQRITAIQSLAAAVAAGRLSLATTASLEEAIDNLTALPGIGSWTAHYIAMRALGEPDAFPAGDLVLRRAAGAPGRPLTEKQLLNRAESWRPWRAYAAIALWQSR